MLRLYFVADADLTNTETSASFNAAGCFVLVMFGFKRYVRATAVTAASSTLVWCILR